MIYTFRNEMKKWRNILWVVLVTFILTTVFSGPFLRHSSPRTTTIGHIEPYNIPVYAYEFLYQARSIEMMREYYKQMLMRSGLTMDLLMGLPDFSKPVDEMAIKNLEEQKLIEYVAKQLSIMLDPTYFTKELIASLHESIFDETGRLDESAYKDFIANAYGISLPVYESIKQEDIKRSLVKQFVDAAVYVTTAQARALYEKEHGKKQFTIVTIPQEFFIAQAKAKQVSDAALVAFYTDHQEQYRVSETRKAQYWTIPQDLYKDSIDIDDDAIEAYYNKNEHSLFRIAPQVKVRTIVRLVPKDASDALRAQVRAEIEALRTEIMSQPDSFAARAKKQSEDKVHAKDGGLVDFFAKGTYDPAFEAAAFSLTKEQPLSEVIATERGYEIVQFVERINASSKPLSLVRNDIITTLSLLRAKQNLGADLSELARKSRADDALINDFFKKLNAKEATTDWITKTASKGYDIAGKVGEKLFDKAKKKLNFGYFTHENNYVFFKETDRNESKIPQFEAIKDQVMTDYYTDESLRAIKTFVKQSRSNILAGTQSMDEVAKLVKTTPLITEKVSQGATLKDVSEAKKLLERAFMLNDTQHQLLKMRTDNGYYLVTLLEATPFDEAGFLAEQEKLKNIDNQSQKKHYYPAFVASLARNATIKTNKNYQEIQHFSKKSYR